MEVVDENDQVDDLVESTRGFFFQNSIPVKNSLLEIQSGFR